MDELKNRILQFLKPDAQEVSVMADEFGTTEETIETVYNEIIKEVS